MYLCNPRNQKAQPLLSIYFTTFPPDITSDGLALDISPSLSDTLEGLIGCASCGGEDAEISADEK